MMATEDREWMLRMSEQARIHRNNQPPEPDRNRDAWEDWSQEFYDPATGREISVRLRITYRDANGTVTHRSVDTEKYFRTKQGGAIMGLCRLRFARRPFQFSRILHAAHPSTGEKITDLGAWLDQRYASSPAGQRDAFVEQHEAALLALFYVAKADDAFRAKEKEILRGFMSAQGATDEQVQESVIKFVGDWAVPSAVLYGRALADLGKRPSDYRDQVIAAAEAMVASDKTMRDDEIRALKRMKASLKDASGKEST